MKKIEHLQIFVVILALALTTSSRRLRCYQNCDDKINVVKCRGSCFYASLLMRTTRGCMPIRHKPGVHLDGYTVIVYCNSDYCNRGPRLNVPAHFIPWTGTTVDL